MKGDFSKWQFDKTDNFNGVLHQQGKVLLDSDWNAQTTIETDWQETAGQDVIGTGVAAVPADAVDSFKVSSAIGIGNQATLTLLPGHAWVDGLLTYLKADASKTTASRLATYLEPPIQPIPSNPNVGDRDAVILEVWREAIHGFQIPNTLIEPALGGPDTTERIHTAVAFRLFRLAAGETCDSIRGKLQADKGKLTVSLQPPKVIAKDCPVVEGGGYTGFEHHLYRIEIAQTTSGDPMFKWSQFNGGLVGRGTFDPVARRVSITANLVAIATSGLGEFYLEAIEYDRDRGHWKVTYGASVTLNNDNELELPTTPIFGAIPATPVFFRLWNGIAKLSDFPVGANPHELRDGIRLEFEAGVTHIPGDYWTFPVRAGEIGNPEMLINAEPPHGIHYHRVPIAVLQWNTPPSVDPIEDCRQPFQPLTRLSHCCTYRVGDGVQSHGDFTSIQTAIEHLPASGGQICVLPGVYRENIQIHSKRNITIQGCGDRSRILSKPAIEDAPAAPVIEILASQTIVIESLAITADDTGIGVLIDTISSNNVPTRATANRPRIPHEITLAKLHIEAATQSAIVVHMGEFITIHNCRIAMKDVASSAPGIYFAADDGLIETNIIQVLAQRGRTNLEFSAPPTHVIAGLGGLQIGGSSDRVRILNNLIQGGMGNGISLGDVVIREPTGRITRRFVGWVIGIEDPCNPSKPGSSYVPPRDPSVPDAPQFSAGDPLSEIYIEGNRIFDMGLSGISAIAFFDLRAVDEFISVDRLTIVKNQIQRCLKRELDPVPQNMTDSMGYGGIALGDVNYLVIRDNEIEDNGLNPLEPICGIFVLHAEGIDIDRNRILNNGEKNDQNRNTIKNGRRGGINIVFGIAAITSLTFNRQTLPIQNGVPAIKVHNNIVSVSLGQALALTALGPVSVIANQFTSRGVILKTPPSPSFIASTIMILNLGLSNELYGQLLAFSSIKNGQLGSMASMSYSNNAVVLPQRGLDDAQIGQYLANGNVLFSDNQCVLDLIETGSSLALSSILIFSLDDVSFQNNQCDANLFDDFILTQAILFGVSLRVNDNRFKEGIRNAFYSAVTLGIMNTTTDNQATHCLLVRGWKQPSPSGWSGEINTSNTILFEGIYKLLNPNDDNETGICDRGLNRAFSNFGRK
jgi:Family of unknown function (DUF6519)